MFLMALAIAPSLAVCLFIFYKDVYDQEPTKYLLMSFFYGMLTIVPAGILETSLFNDPDDTVFSVFLTSYLLIAAVEEGFKFIVLRFYCYRRPTFDEPLDGIVYSVMVSMGFATLENVGYVWLHGFPVAFVRMFTSVPAHATFGVIMGYYLGKSKFDWPNRKKLLWYSFLGATLMHGTYDLFLLLGENNWVKQYVSELLLFGGALGSLFISVTLSRKLLHQHHITSLRLFTQSPVLTFRNASISDINLIRTLSMQVWPQTYSTILTQPQIMYMLEIMYSPAAIRRQMDEQHQFIIVYNAGVPVGFASYSETEPSIFRLHKLYVLPVHQGRGTGKSIISQIINEVTTKGAQILQLNVNRLNKAKTFYEKMGFEAIRSEDIDIGNGFFMNDYVMEKRLQSI
ncbi:GNAT family N-acetyltransferase [Chitinophagaceae bacterium LB-8]|uniref:GNAT family N-acetyltransferase n=1 Tax=Paraflavisolibacter caeni TaxID=2982496 RepID=A0A9X3B6A7_9BACT|nr:GNAT family N-acetyltransferase [Paraflavisolibacter caeni]MCU7547730.1 GNAT family N-acetyltransferase [Paraflavisolibacter caeni]